MFFRCFWLVFFSSNQCGRAPYLYKKFLKNATLEFVILDPYKLERTQLQYWHTTHCFVSTPVGKNFFTTHSSFKGSTHSFTCYLRVWNRSQKVVTEINTKQSTEKYLSQGDLSIFLCIRTKTFPVFLSLSSVFYAVSFFGYAVGSR